MRSSATTVERTTAPVGVIFAVVLHAVVIVATLFTWSHTTLDIDDQAAPIVPVDLVTLGAKTNIAPMVKQQPKEPPKQEDVQPPAPEKAQAAPAAPEEAAPPPPDESAAAAPVKPIPQIVPKTKPQPDQKKDKFDINNIMALLDKRAHGGELGAGREDRPTQHQGLRRAERDDDGSRRLAAQPDRAVLEPAGRRAAPRSADRFVRAVPEPGRLRRTAATIDR